METTKELKQRAKLKKRENEFEIARVNGFGIFDVEGFLRDLGSEYYYSVFVEILDEKRENKRLFDSIICSPIYAVNFLLFLTGNATATVNPPDSSYKSIDFESMKEDEIIQEKYVIKVDVVLLTKKAQEIEHKSFIYKNYANDTIIKNSLKNEMAKFSKEIAEMLTKHD